MRLQYDRITTQQAIAIYRQVLANQATEDTRVAALSGSGLGAAFEQLGLLVDSLGAYRQALELAERSPDRLLESRLRSAVGVAQALAGDQSQFLDDAERQCEQGLNMARRAGGIGEEAAALNCLGEVAYTRGSLAPALEFYGQAEELWKRLDHRRGLAQASLSQGWVYSDLGQFQRARECFEEATSIWTLVGDQRQLAITLVAQARLRQRRGEYQGALDAFDRAQALLEPMGDAVWQGASLTGTAQVLLNTAEVTPALNHWEKALRVFEVAGLKSIQVDVLMSVGSTMLASGDDIGALTRFERAMALAMELDNLRWQAWANRYIGSTYLFRKEATIARQHLDRALEIVPSLGEKRLEASVLADMGEVYVQLDQYPRALRYFDQALASSRAAGDRDGAARQLLARGALEGRLGNLASARTSLTAALTEQEQLFGSAHPLVAETRVALAGIDFASGAHRLALAAALSAEATSRVYLRETLRYLPERQALTFAQLRARGLDLAISLAVSRAAVPTARVLDDVIQSRGLVLDELARRRHSAAPADPKVAELLMGANRASQRFANLLVLSVEGGVPRDQLDEARDEKETAERALASRSAEARTEMARTAVGLEDVREALPLRAALISFVQYGRSSTPTGRGQWTAVPSLAVFVLHADRRPPILVPLGDVEDIEQLITEWRAEASGQTLLASASASRADVTYRTAGNRLRRAIWDPVATHLRGADRVFVVPDGAVGLVPLAALPVGMTSYLLEHGPPIHYLSAERDLVATSTKPTVGSGGLLALGGPSFDAAPSAARAAAASDATAAGDAVRRGSQPGCLSLRSLRFQPLGGTLQEVQELSKVWTESAGSSIDAARVLVGAQASESTFKRDASRYRVLHLATHGFFLSGDCARVPTGARGVGGLSGARRSTDNPLLLSGLALAGANRRASAALDEDDGILTAEEVASLDLSRVEWAVLSACDTGVGEIRAGEGVFGLRRAFQVAGARTVIMSLWSVDDQATREWMRALYQGRFQRNLSTADAVHEASLSMLRERRAKGQSTHPFYWAAFVAAGDWR